MQQTQERIISLGPNRLWHDDETVHRLRQLLKSGHPNVSGLWNAVTRNRTPDRSAWSPASMAQKSKLSAPLTVDRTKGYKG